VDTYEPERRAAAEASLRLSRRMHEGYRPQVADPDRMYEEIAIDYLRGMMFYGYRTEIPDLLTDVAYPGCRLPHRWLAPEVSTLDLVGTRWTVLTGHEQWTAVAAEAGVAAHRLDGDVFGAVTGLPADGAVLVRPDGFVEWCGPGLEPVGVLREALPRR
jgi:hypothetical protein